jgi:hypothetical protein
MPRMLHNGWIKGNSGRYESSFVSTVFVNRPDGTQRRIIDHRTISHYTHVDKGG